MPKFSHDITQYDGDEYVMLPDEITGRCCNCKTVTNVYSILLSVFLCSTECADKIWKEFVENPKMYNAISRDEEMYFPLADDDSMDW